MRFSLLHIFFSASLVHSIVAAPSPPAFSQDGELIPSTTFDDYEDGFTPYEPTPIALAPRATTSGTYTCDQNNPCGNHACCGKSGYCGYGPTYCGTTGTSPNDQCWSNCDAKAECGQYAKTPNTTCPLNVCCSQFGFCGTTSDFCATGCQSNCGQPGSGGSNGDVQKRIIGYYESWSIGKQCMDMEPNQIPVKSLTHLNYAFAYAFPGDFSIGPMPGTDPKTFSQITGLKSKNSGLIVGISIGGWTYNDNGTNTQPVFHNIVSSAANRAKFISNLQSFLDNYGFDAVDLDWEYPGAPDRGGSGDMTDGNGYVSLLQEMRKAFDASHRKIYISFTAPTSYWYMRWFPIGKMVAAADYVNFMTYDLHGTWDSTDPIGSIVLAHTNLTEIDLALDLLWRNGVDPSKVNLGLAEYSRTFTLKDKACTTPGCPFASGGAKGGCTDTAGILSYREITDVLASHNITPIYDQVNAVKYFTWNQDQWAAYDDKQTFQQKIKYANSKGLGGLLIWAVDQDTANLDAMRGIIYPKDLTHDNVGDDVNFWNNQQIGTCETTECGGSCAPGTIEITQIQCPKGGSKAPKQKLCCPLASAPDPKTCSWRGGPGLCNGQCHGGEVALASSKDGGNGHCTDGRQFYCCPIPEVADGVGINCGWQDSCRSDQTLLTFAGTFLEDLDPVLRFGGLVGNALANALDQYDIKDGKRYCCGNTEAQNWQQCYWAGTTGKGIYSCDDNHCNTGIEVELTTSYFGYGETCAPMIGRQRAFCCTPASGKSLFLPVPLEDLFPHPPPANVADPIFNLETDDTWGTGHEEGKNDPNDASFGFVVITAPTEVHVSLRKRSGTPWEIYGCTDTESEDDQTIQMVCVDEENPDSRCNDIHKGYGAVGTIIELPDRCGPGKYAVVKDMALSIDQRMPAHLLKRGVTGTVYDLTFDYDFRRVPRDFGDTQMRVDFSNQEGYWNGVVNRPGQTRKKRSEMEDFERNRKRWLQDEWDDAYHHGGLSREELHKRWFGSSVVAWLANLIGVGTATVTQGVHHTVNEDLDVILIDQQFGPCAVGPGTAEGSLRAKLNAHLEIDTSFGLTIIASLTNDGGITFQDSYLYFNNKGEVTVGFTLDAIATWSYTSGDIKLIGLDNFPGATFRVPGIVTVGPNAEVYGRVDAVLTFAGHVEAKATVASWQVQQTYPQNNQYPEKTLQDPNQQGTTGTDPTLSASVSVNGEVQMHLRPQVTFGIVFDSRWGVPDTAARLVLDGYVIFSASAGGTTVSGGNTCPFSYEVDAGADMYVQVTAPSLFGWGGNQQISLGGLRRVPVVPRKCIGGSSSKRDLLAIAGSENATYYGMDARDSVVAASVPGSLEHLQYLYDSGLSKRDTFSIGPIITIPSGFLNCPIDDSKDDGGCAVCQSDNSPSPDGDSLSNKKRDDPSDPNAAATVAEQPCPWCGQPSDLVCSNSDVAKRANSAKDITLPWSTNPDFFSNYPACSGINAAGSGVTKWYMPQSESLQTPRTCNPAIVKASRSGSTVLGRVPSDFATDHVFEVHLLADFIFWLVGQSRINYVSGPIQWQAAFGTQPDATWAQAVLGTSVTNGGFQFPAFAGDNSPANFLQNAAETAFGGLSKLNLLAIYYDKANGMKRLWTTNAVRPVTGAPLKEIISSVQLSASTFDYLNNYVTNAWTAGGLNMETLCVQFDNAWWAAGNANNRNNAPGRQFVRGAAPGGATNWGLRTIWNYWLEQHLEKIGQGIGTYLNNAKNEINANLNQAASPNSQAVLNNARNFLNTYMAPGRIASQSVMRFPQNAGAPLLGSGAASANSQIAKYGMWSYQSYGVNGI